MTYRILNSFLAALIIPLISCGQNEYSLNEKVQSVLKGSVPTVTSVESQKLESAKFLDAREIEEFNVSHIPNSIHVGHKKFDLNSVESIALSDTIIVYCTVGYRSEQIGDKLQKAGYENVFNLFGGIFSWKNNGYEVVDMSKKSTEKVHCYNKLWSVFLEKGEKVY